MITNKNPIAILRNEHDKVLKILDVLEENLKDKNTEKLGENIILLEKEFDKHSLNKEEKVLFPEMEKFMPREGGPIGVMVIEHRELVKSINDFKEKLEREDINHLDQIGNHIISLLRQHIDKENNILFMMAENHLDDEQKKIILEKFKQIDEESQK